MLEASVKSLLFVKESEIACLHEFQEGEGNEPLVMASEDEVIGLEHLLAEPNYSDNSIDSVLGLHMFSTENSSSLVLNGDQRVSTDMLDLTAIQAEEKTGESLNEVLQKGDSESSAGANSFFSTCEEFLFDAQTSEEAHDLDHGSCEGFCLASCAVGSQCPAAIEELTVVEISEVSTTGVPHLESTWIETLPFLEHLTISELHEAYRNTFGHETSIVDEEKLKYYISFRLRDLGDLENSLTALECSNKNHEETVFSSTNGYIGVSSECLMDVSRGKALHGNLPVNGEELAGCDSSSDMHIDVNDLSDPRKRYVLGKEKRIRKPPCRYIDEPLLMKKRQKRTGTSYKSSSGKPMHVKVQKQPQQLDLRSTIDLVCQEESSIGPCIQVPFGPLVQNSGVKSFSSVQGCQPRNRYENRLTDEKSDFKTHAAASRYDRSDGASGTETSMEMVRSHSFHKQWTLSEVMKLIEGVSLCGVGRWAEIKRQLFSSTRRRPTDLKDKWRNLLKASCMELKTRKKVELGWKHTSHHLPQAVLRRVRELALVDPNARKQAGKASCSSSTPVAAQTAPSTSNMVPLSAPLLV